MSFSFAKKAGDAVCSRTRAVMASAVFGLTSPIVVGQPATYSGNCHTYQVVVQGGVSWDEAAALAAQAGGYLVTLTTPDEDAFVGQLCINTPGAVVTYDATHKMGPWIGLHQMAGSAEPDGGWVWVTGEPLAYLHWDPAAPNDNCFGSAEDKAHYYSSSAFTGRWNDMPVSGVCNQYRVPGYVIEWDDGLMLTVSPAGLLPVCRSETVELNVQANGIGPFAYQWRHNGEAINSDQNPSALTATFRISSIQDRDAGAYDCTVSSGCGNANSQVITLLVEECCPECPADYNANGGVEGDDVAAFFIDYEAGSVCADIDLNGGVDAGDIGYFFSLFEAGGC